MSINTMRDFKKYLYVVIYSKSNKFTKVLRV